MVRHLNPGGGRYGGATQWNRDRMVGGNVKEVSIGFYFITFWLAGSFRLTDGVVTTHVVGPQSPK